MSRKRTKKSLGQHFLKEKILAGRIVSEISEFNLDKVIEIGPGRGILTTFLINTKYRPITVIEIDRELVKFLEKRFNSSDIKIIEADVLKYDFKNNFKGKIGLIGNFPYNISSQIVFKILDNRDLVNVMVGMFQKEVAERIVTGSGSKKYGILSVLVQAFYTTEYLFTVDEENFDPPPKVKSAVIRLKRNNVNHLACDELLFKRVVKACFNQRRKTIRNSIKSVVNIINDNNPILSKRPEQLNVQEFIELTGLVENNL